MATNELKPALAAAHFTCSGRASDSALSGHRILVLQPALIEPRPRDLDVSDPAAIEGSLTAIQRSIDQGFLLQLRKAASSAFGSSGSLPDVHSRAESDEALVCLAEMLLCVPHPVPGTSGTSLLWRFSWGRGGRYPWNLTGPVDDGNS